MSREWEATERVGQSKRPVKKWKEDWIWEPAKLKGQAGSLVHGAVGELLAEDTHDCGFCRGSGYKPRGSLCSVCRGSGRVSVDPPAVVCAYCKGGGEEKPRSNVTCTACRGKGVIPVEEPIEACPRCRGRGADPHSKLPCGVCRGRGVVTVKEEDQEPEETEPWEDEETEEEELQPEAPEPPRATNSPAVAPPSPKAATSQDHEIIRPPSGSEREAMEAIKEANGAADRFRIGWRMGVSVAYADMLCRALIKKGLLTRDASGIHRLTPRGEKALAPHD